MSYPDRVMVMKVSANKPGKISLEAKLKSPFLEKTTAKDGKLTYGWHMEISSQQQISWLDCQG